MDDRKFDALTRALASGQSRRALLKGILGLGGAVAGGGTIIAGSDARTTGSRPTIPPPLPPACPAGQALCNGVCCPNGRCLNGVCCPAAGTSRCGAGCCITGQCTSDGDCCAANQEVCGTICCSDGTCGRAGSTDVCCASPDVRTTSGECCDNPLQRCDTDCCPDDTVCLTRVFPEGPLVEEEVCCPAEQTCDNQCCTGDCFDPEGGVGTAQVLNPDFECCPAEGEVCEGANGIFCCQGETPQCCVRGEDRIAACIAADACCLDEDCPGECDLCDRELNQCVDVQQLCQGECDACYQGQCIGCDTNETCCVNAPFPTCIDVSQPGVCCTSDQCPDSPATCEEGICTATVCSLQPVCDGGEICCLNAAGGFNCVAGATCPEPTTMPPTTTTAPSTTTTTPVPPTTPLPTTPPPTTPSPTTPPPTTPPPTTSPPCTCGTGALCCPSATGGFTCCSFGTPNCCGGQCVAATQCPCAADQDCAGLNLGQCCRPVCDAIGVCRAVDTPALCSAGSTCFGCGCLPNP